MRVSIHRDIAIIFQCRKPQQIQPHVHLIQMPVRCKNAMSSSLDHICIQKLRIIVRISTHDVAWHTRQRLDLACIANIAQMNQHLEFTDFFPYLRDCKLHVLISPMRITHYQNPQHNFLLLVKYRTHSAVYRWVASLHYSTSRIISKARPRWLILFLSSGASSAVVFPYSGRKKIGS